MNSVEERQIPSRTIPGIVLSCTDPRCKYRLIFQDTPTMREWADKTFNKHAEKHKQNAEKKSH